MMPALAMVPAIKTGVEWSGRSRSRETEEEEEEEEAKSKRKKKKQEAHRCFSGSHAISLLVWPR